MLNSEDLKMPEIIETIGEHGEKVTMKLNDIVEVEGQTYALMSDVSEANNIFKTENNENDDDVLVIMRMNKTGEEYTFEMIEDDNEFNTVAAAIKDQESDDEEDADYDVEDDDGFEDDGYDDEVDEDEGDN